MPHSERLNTVEAATNVHEILAGLDGNFNTYWQQFGEMSSGEYSQAAEINQGRELALTKKLYDPSVHTGNVFVDKLSPVDTAKEWYLSLGSLNQLRSAGPALLLAAATLWEQPRQGQPLNPNIVDSYLVDDNSLRRGQIPERMRQALTDEVSLGHIVLAGQATLDIARISETGHVNEKMWTARLASDINQGLFKALLARPGLSSEQGRALSDSLKAQYDAKFDALALKRSTGELADSDYEGSYNQSLAEQVQDTLKAANKMSLGDLNEHYSTLLMRYALNTWQERSDHLVMSATRRQDEPHDGLARRHLPRFSYDVIILEPNQQKTMFIQLKTTHQEDSLPYADGIEVVDSVLTPNASNSDLTRELTAGLTQMQGLLREVITGNRYVGDSQIISKHVASVLGRLRGD